MNFLSFLEQNLIGIKMIKKISERDRIKKKINQISPKKWKADEFDVRYYLISKLKQEKNQTILDVGGGIGIILSELDKKNYRVNIDLSFDDLKKCIHDLDSKINPICASITFLPFRKDIFDIVICSHVIELAKLMDINKKTNGGVLGSENVLTLVKDTHRVLKINGKLFLTTPNFAYRQSLNKLTFTELNQALSKFFKEFKIYFYNTLPKLSKNRKFDFANIIPKIRSKYSNPDQIINSLLKEESKNNYSVYFTLME